MLQHLLDILPVLPGKTPVMRLELRPYAFHAAKIAQRVRIALHVRSPIREHEVVRATKIAVHPLSDLRFRVSFVNDAADGLNASSRILVDDECNRIPGSWTKKVCYRCKVSGR